MNALWAAAATGLVGSLHCAAMCGPLAVAGCSSARRGAGYFGGRLISYALAGAVFGSAGARLADALALVWMQRLALAAVAVGAAWRGVCLLRAGRAARQPADGPVPLRVRRPRSRWWSVWLELAPRRGLGLGLVTGFLPCGMLAAGWLLAAATGNPLRGAAVMAVFWASTSPGLLGALLARPLARRVPRKIAALAWCGLAIFLVLRPTLDAFTHAAHTAHADHAAHAAHAAHAEGMTCAGTDSD